MRELVRNARKEVAKRWAQVEPPSLGLETFRTEVGGDAAELPASQMAMVHWVRSMAGLTLQQQQVQDRMLRLCRKALQAMPQIPLLLMHHLPSGCLKQALRQGR